MNRLCPTLGRQFDKQYWYVFPLPARLYVVQPWDVQLTGEEVWWGFRRWSGDWRGEDPFGEGFTTHASEQFDRHEAIFGERIMNKLQNYSRGVAEPRGQTKQLNPRACTLHHAPNPHHPGLLKCLGSWWKGDLRGHSVLAHQLSDKEAEGPTGIKRQPQIMKWSSGTASTKS